jgi:hypothetical protein
MFTCLPRPNTLIWIALVGLAFVLGMLLATPYDATHADFLSRDGYNNLVLEITQAGAGLKARAEPSTAARELDTLLWGDRVLWTGQATNADGYRWLRVAIGDGRTAWIVDVSGWTVEIDPVYTTPDMGRGAVVRITQAGDASHCRMLPSSASTEYETMSAGDQMTVIGGPYQAEYWIWWQYRLGNGFECWIVDVPGWIAVVTPGTF